MILLLAACSGYNTTEAHMVFDRANDVGFESYLNFFDAKDNAGDRDSGDFVWTNDGDSWSFDGTVTGDGSNDWTGTVNLYGEAEWTATSLEGAWGVEYLEVEQDGIVMDGEMDWTLALEGDHSSGSLDFTALGEITASGDAEGTGSVDYEAGVEVDANSFSFEATGDVDGTPIDSHFTLTVL
jgi:hypothetical protein